MMMMMMYHKHAQISWRHAEPRQLLHAAQFRHTACRALPVLTPPFSVLLPQLIALLSIVAEHIGRWAPERRQHLTSYM